MRVRQLITGIATVVFATLAVSADVRPEEPGRRSVTYTDDVAPILERYCIACHSPGQQGTQATGLLLDSYAAVMQGSSFGPVVHPGDSKTSTLYNLVTGDDHLTVRMPHGSAEPLSSEEIETIREWIDNGAPES